MWCLTMSLSLSHWHPGSGVVVFHNVGSITYVTIDNIVLQLIFVKTKLFDFLKFHNFHNFFHGLHNSVLF